MESTIKIKEDIKLKRLIGLARRAGALSYGTEGCIKDLREKKSELIIMSSDISEKTKKEIIYSSDNVDILISDITKEELGKIIGTRPTAVISVNDSNFKKGIYRGE